MVITFDPTVGSRSNSYWSFLDALLHGVDEESIFGDDEVWLHHARVTVRNGLNFEPTVGSRSNSYWSFRMPFSTEWMRNGYAVMMRSGRAMLE